MKQADLLFARYQNGEYRQVWEELRALGDAVREPAYLPQAMAVARETMRRVRTNTETVYRRLLDLGYEFQFPEEALVPPRPDTPRRLEQVQQRFGHLPLSLAAFYLEVGTVNFMQSGYQLVQYHKLERETAPELLILGEQDPLMVDPIWGPNADIEPTDGGTAFYLAPDEFHKAHYSGGENYHVALPDAAADFRILGMYDVDEYFVDYLRVTFQFGGFRGRMDASVAAIGVKTPPGLSIIGELADGLLLF